MKNITLKHRYFHGVIVAAGKWTKESKIPQGGGPTADGKERGRREFNRPGGRGNGGTHPKPHRHFVFPFHAATGLLVVCCFFLGGGTKTYQRQKQTAGVHAGQRSVAVRVVGGTT